MRTILSLNLQEQKQSQILDNTLGICSICHKIVLAQIVERVGKIFIEKKCCKQESLLIENDAGFYKEAILPFKWKLEYIKEGMNNGNLELRIKMLEDAPSVCLYITAFCSLNCPICYLKFNTVNLLNDPKVHKSLDSLIFIFRRLKPKYFSIAGGEPTIHKDLPKIIKSARKFGHMVGIATNGLRLVDKKYLECLKNAGINNVLLSFDSLLNNKVYEKLRGVRLLRLKYMALKNLKELKVDTWIYMVVKRGLNEDEIGDMVRFAAYNNDFIKGITFEILEEENPSYEKKITPSDIYKIIENEFKIDIKTFIEEKKFRFGTYTFIGKIFGGNIQKKFLFLRDDTFYFDVTNKKIKPLILMKEYKKMNEVLERSQNERSKIKAILTLFKYFKVFLNSGTRRLFKIFLTGRFNYIEASMKTNSENSILRMKVGNLIIDKYEDINRKNTIETLGICNVITPL